MTQRDDDFTNSSTSASTLGFVDDSARDEIFERPQQQQQQQQQYVEQQVLSN
jgi:hypothetical protein